MNVDDKYFVDLEKSIRKQIMNVLLQGNESVSLKAVNKWMLEEYRNYMIISREDYKKTLETIIFIQHPLWRVAKVLLNNIDRYGAPKVYFKIARKEYKLIQSGIKQ